MQVSHLQEAVRQNESVSYYLESGATVCPPESYPAGYLDQVRQHLAVTDNVIKIGIDVYAGMWEHGRAAPAVLDLQNQQNRAYHPRSPVTLWRDRSQRTGGVARDGVTVLNQSVVYQGPLTNQSWFSGRSRTSEYNHTSYTNQIKRKTTNESLPENFRMIANYKPQSTLLTLEDTFQT